MLKLIENNTKQSTLSIIGDIRTILEGKVSSNSLIGCDLHQVAFALGGGTCSQIEALGETLIANHKAYVSHSDLSGNLFTHSKKNNLKGQFLLAIKKEELPSHLLTIEKSLSFEQFLGNCFELSPLAFAIVGYFEFTPFSGTQVIKAPIYGENLLTHPEYFSGEEVFSKTQGIAFGVGISEKGQKLFPKKILDTAFYQNPQDTTHPPFLAHTHIGLTHKTPVETPKAIKDFFTQLDSLSIHKVYHLLNQSVISHASFVLYSIKNIEHQ